MRRATRSSSGRPTSPDAELLQEYHDRSTRSRKPSGLPISPDTELLQEPEERATRSRKPSEDLVVLELPRITRIGKRSGSGRSPEPPKLSPRGGRSAEGGHKHEKRGLSPAEESARETSTKRRRRSGRLVEEDVEKEKQEMQEKDEKDDGDKRDKVSEKKGKSPRERKHDINLKEKGVKEKDPKEKEDKEVKAKVKDKHQDIVTKEHKKVEESTTTSKEPSGKSRRRTRSGRQGTDGDEESSTHSHQPTQQDSKPDHPEKSDGDKSTDEPASKHQNSKDPGRPSSKSGQDKEKLDTPRLRSPPRSPEKSRKVETAKVELLNVNLDLGELTVKTSSKPSPRGALSPALRMSPRRARQPSGQKSYDDPESAENEDTQNKNSGEEITPSTAPSHKESTEHNTTSEKDKTKDKPDKRKKPALACRDISKDFDESKEIPQSPTRLTRAKKEEDFPAKKEDTPGNDDEILSWQSKSHKAKKSRSPMKSPRDSSLSPRKGLRSGRAPEADGTPDHNRAQEQDQVNVVAMETEWIPPPVCSDTYMAQKEVTVSQEEEQNVQPLPELDRAPTFGELLAAEKQAKEADDVTEISDEVAAKIREWRVQEEESVGFQGEEWYAEEVDEGEPFYYESDHMALKGNKDYRMLLRTITTLEAQRKQAVKDLDKLVTAQREALRNPLKFVHKLQKKDTLHLPSPQRIVLLPEIPWGRYLGHADSKELILGLSHQTRASLKPKDSAEDPGAGTSSSSVPIEDQDEDEKNKSVIRGRLWDETKPDTFNRLWTVNEQKRLEDLLTTYPSEEVEARRWEKIAKALGNRTRHQVASRVQKYFIKLGKAGLPIPGRMPNMATYTLKKPSQRRYMNPYNRLTMAPSTFLQSIRAPVLMNEDDDDDAFDYELDYDADSIMEEDDIPSELKGSEEYKELVRLKKLRNITLKQQTDMSHVGYSCDGCGVAPIVGVRWHCVNCPMEISTDLCQSCVNDDFQSEVHRSSHRMDPVHIGQSAGFVDSDYTSFTGTSGDYNYLDPNYSPAVL